MLRFFCAGLCVLIIFVLSVESSPARYLLILDGVYCGSVQTAREAGSGMATGRRDHGSGIATGKRQHKPVMFKGSSGWCGESCTPWRVAFEYGVHSPRDSASGQASGRRSSIATGDLDGDGYLDVVVDATSRPSFDGFVKKHIGKPKYEDITIRCGVRMAKPFYDWLSAPYGTRKSGAIVAADYDYREVSRRTFTDALITDIVFPSLYSDEPDLLYVTLSVESASEETLPAGSTGVKFSVASPSVQPFAMAGGAITIQGLDRMELGSSSGALRVNKIESFTIKQRTASSLVDDTCGSSSSTDPSEYSAVTAPELRLDSGDIELELEGDIKPLSDWYEATKKAAADPKSDGTLDRTVTITTYNSKSGCVELSLTARAGIYKLDRVAAAPGSPDAWHCVLYTSSVTSSFFTPSGNGNGNGGVRTCDLKDFPA
eukprot:TRINITY_DN15032_c0_g1_i1.p1 TRINITY_DN15032_c0_g1~~TRINITY_DN15032_c0_g1_i1.p1  ORF type:complete len:430 (-),score=80.22 TRINITY_DN15032_c0_g1_i1:92-1381(-)